MPNTIWAYPVGPYSGDHAVIAMPKGARILSCAKARADQLHNVTVYALIDPSKPTSTHKIAFYGHGEGVNVVPDGADYIGSVVASEYITFHVFDLGEE